MKNKFNLWTFIFKQNTNPPPNQPTPQPPYEPTAISTHSDYSHQEGKHDAVAHNLDKAVTTSGLLGVSGVKITSEDIDFAYTGVGGTKHRHPMGTIKQKDN